MKNVANESVLNDGHFTYAFKTIPIIIFMFIARVQIYIKKWLYDLLLLLLRATTSCIDTARAQRP